MTTLQVKIDDQLSADLESMVTPQGLSAADFVADLVRKHMDTERLRQQLADPELAALCKELAEEDVALAEAGLAEYQQLLDAADRA